MAYIGKSPVIGNFVKLDAITAVNGQAAYTMQNGGSNFTDYESVNQFLVSLNGTIQAPTDSFTVSGSTLTFASNLSTGDVIDFIMVFGNSLSAGTPTDATVSTAKIVDGAVSLAKLSASGTKSSSTFLRGDNTFAAAGLSGWSENGSNNDLLPGNASAGIYLGVNSATAANLLDDYEEGTFTPTFIDQNNTQATSYTNNSSASYTKIGNICYVMMDIEFNSIDSSNLGIYAGIGGYPFTCINAQSSMTGQLALYQTEFGNEEFGTTIEHNKANGIFYHNGSTVSPGTIGTQLRAFFNFAYKTA